MLAKLRGHLESREELLELLSHDPAGIDLHSGLTIDAISHELDRKLHELADQGDILMIAIRQMASKVRPCTKSD